MPECSLPRSWRCIPQVVVLCAAVVPYLGVLDAPFVFDDVRLVQQNTLLSSGLDDSGGWLATFDVTSRRWDSEELRPNYRPLRFLSYLLDYKLSLAWLGSFAADDPPVLFFHLTNVLLHALNALLVFLTQRPEPLQPLFLAPRAETVFRFREAIRAFFRCCALLSRRR